MRVQDLLKIMNMQLDYKIIDRFYNQEIYNNYDKFNLSKQEIDDLRNRIIYLIFPCKDDTKAIIEIYVF